MNSTFTKLIPMASLACLVLVSCKKNDALTSTPVQNQQLSRTTSIIGIGSEETNAEIADVLDAESIEAIESGDPTNCKVVTNNPSRKVYPHTKTVDFGTGCTDAAGKTKSGKRITTFYADPRTAPSGTRVSVTTFSNYYVNDLNVSGSAVTYVVNAANPGPYTLRIVSSKTFTDSHG